MKLNLERVIYFLGWRIKGNVSGSSCGYWLRSGRCNRWNCLDCVRNQTNIGKTEKILRSHTWIPMTISLIKRPDDCLRKMNNLERPMIALPMNATIHKDTLYFKRFWILQQGAVLFEFYKILGHSCETLPDFVPGGKLAPMNNSERNWFLPLSSWWMN